MPSAVADAPVWLPLEREGSIPGAFFPASVSALSVQCVISCADAGAAVIHPFSSSIFSSVYRTCCEKAKHSHKTGGRLSPVAE